MNAICEIGCIVCRNTLGVYSPACPHHMDGKTKAECHFKTIPLCGTHHQSGSYGTAFHEGRVAWEKKYGTEADLLKQCQEIING